MNIRTLITIFAAVFFVSCTAKEPLSPGAQITAPGRGVLKKYSSFYIAPIRLYKYSDDTLEPGYEPEVSQAFLAKLKRQFANKLSMFPQPSAGVAEVQVSLSNVYVPQSVYQMRPGLVIEDGDEGGALIEVRFRDSVSEKDLLTYRDSQRGSGSVFDSWAGVKGALDLWAAELAEITNF